MMSILPDTQVIVKLFNGDCGLDAAKLATCPAVNVILCDATPLNEIPPRILQDPVELSHCIETNVAPFDAAKLSEPDVNVVVKNSTLLNFLLKITMWAFQNPLP
jgi:hypothetical protein